MVASGKMPALGGEMRNVAVFFSDLAGFSSIAEKMTPGELVTLMNDYLSEMTDIIEHHGGYVDKYIGDSIVAMFGAPADDPDHARSAVAAALTCRDRLAALNESHPAFPSRSVAHRIGLGSGEAVVGNIGSRRRFNYTVMSDTANLASRLEGANKYFGTAIMASEMTVAQCGDALHLARARYDSGCRAATSLSRYSSRWPPRAEKLVPAGCAAVYCEGLARWRARDFAGCRRPLRKRGRQRHRPADILRSARAAGACSATGGLDARSIRWKGNSLCGNAHNFGKSKIFGFTLFCLTTCSSYSLWSRPVRSLWRAYRG